MKKTLRLLTVLALFLSMIALPIDSNARTFDNTFNFTGTFGLVNPCNGELVSGPIDIHIVVSSNETGNGPTKVNVHHSSHGTLADADGNQYQISRRARGQFDAVSNAYVLEWTGNFIGKGSAPNFVASGTVTVRTNANNEPVGSNGTVTSSSCRSN